MDNDAHAIAIDNLQNQITALKGIAASIVHRVDSPIRTAILDDLARFGGPRDDVAYIEPRMKAVQVIYDDFLNQFSFAPSNRSSVVSICRHSCAT